MTTDGRGESGEHGTLAALDPGAAEVRRFPTAGLRAGSLPRVEAAVIDPDVTVAQLLNHASGPLPLTAECDTHGGTLLVFVAGTGRVDGFEAGFGYPLGIAIEVDGCHSGQATVLAFNSDRHAFANTIVVNGLAWGRHIIRLTSFKNVTAADERDLFNLTVLEI